LILLNPCIFNHSYCISKNRLKSLVITIIIQIMVACKQLNTGCDACAFESVYCKEPVTVKSLLYNLVFGYALLYISLNFLCFIIFFVFQACVYECIFI